MTDRNVDRLRFSAAALLGSAGRQRPSLAPRRLGAGPTPWELGSPDSDRAPENHYPCMPLAQIEALQVPAADNAVLYLWAAQLATPRGAPGHAVLGLQLPDEPDLGQARSGAVPDERLDSLLRHELHQPIV